MYNRIFISHSSKNAWLLEAFLKMIRDVNPEVDIFCSSEAVIPPGGNYKEEIFTKLAAADMFIAVISEEYWKSRYSILELGAAYERYCFDNNSVSIQPVLVPPLDKGMALANTPLVEVQLTDLTNLDSIALLLRKIAVPDKEELIGSMDIRIAEYSSAVRRAVLGMTSLTKDVECGAYYDEPADNRIPKDRIVRCQRPDEDTFILDFHLSRIDYTDRKPSFASLALEYWEEIDFTEYLKFDKDAAFCFRIDNMNGVLNSINVEFKIGETHRVYKTVRKELAPGINEISIPLEPMNRKPLKEINQICFVIDPDDLNSDDGAFVIDRIEVEFEAKNILENKSM